MGPIIHFGLLFNLALVIGFYTSHLTLGASPENFIMCEIVGYSVTVISSFAVFMGIKDDKQKQAPAPLGFIDAFGVGLVISLIAAHMFALYNWLYLTFIHPTFTATYVQHPEQSILSSGPEPSVIEQ